MSYTVLARKWRPKNFSELVGQAHVMQALSNALDSNRLHHAYLFTGTRGVGKTTIARIFSKALNCQEGISSTPCGVCDTCKAIDEGRFIDLIEVDAASRTKVDDTREILDNVQFAPTQGRYKVYLIDEVHMLSKSSFNALLKTLEEPPEHVKFLLATTDPHKLPSTVLSRCLQFNLMRLTQTQIQDHLAYILQQENLPFESSALALIAKSADGSARDALSLLDQAIAYGAGEIHFEQVQTMLGLVDQQYTVAILQALAEESSQQVKELVQQLAAMGVDYSALLAQLIETLHALSYKQVLGGISDTSLLPEAVISELSEQLSADRVQLLYQIALLSKQDMQLAPDIRIGFEMALIRMLAFQPSDAPVSDEPTGNTSAKSNLSSPSHSSNKLGGASQSLEGTAGQASAITQPKQSSSPAPQANSSYSSHDSMLVDQDPQTVLAGLSSARALMAKKKPLDAVSSESIPSQPFNEFVQAPRSEPSTLSNSENYQSDNQMNWQANSQAGFNHAQPIMDDAPPWDLDTPNHGEQASHSFQPEQRVPLQNASANSASDHLSQIKQRLKQPLGKPEGQGTKNTTDRQVENDVFSSNLSRLSAIQSVKTPALVKPDVGYSEPNSAFDHAYDDPLRANDMFAETSQHAVVEQSVAQPVNAKSMMANLNRQHAPGYDQNDEQTCAPDHADNALVQESLEKTYVEPVQPVQVDSSPAASQALIELDYVALNEENRLTVWLEVLQQFQPEGMAAELTRQSVLVEYSPTLWRLSVDPEQAYAQSDMAVLRLTEAIHLRFGNQVVLEFVDFYQHNTPTKHEQYLAVEKQKHAELSIQNDPVVHGFINELGMEVISNSVSPID